MHVAFNTIAAQRSLCFLKSISCMCPQVSYVEVAHKLGARHLRGGVLGSTRWHTSKTAKHLAKGGYQFSKRISHELIDMAKHLVACRHHQARSEVSSASQAPREQSLA